MTDTIADIVRQAEGDSADDLNAALARVIDELKTMPPPTTAENIAAEVNAAIRNGQPIPTGFGDRIASLAGDQAAYVAANDVLNRIAGGLAHDIFQIRKSRVNQILTALNADLEQLVTAASPILASLATVDNAEQAIDQDLAAQWKQANDLAGRLTRIRLAQTEAVAMTRDTARAYPPNYVMTVQASSATIELVQSFGSVRDYLENWHRGPARKDSMGNVVQAIITRPWLDNDPLEVLRWICSADAQPWVPTLRQLEDKQTETRRAAQQSLAERNKAAWSMVSTTPPPDIDAARAASRTEPARQTTSRKG